MKQCEIAVYGLGVMGSSLAKNMISHGFRVAVYNKSEKGRRSFQAEGSNYRVCETVEEMLDCLESPKRIFLMIAAGSPVDAVLDELLPKLSPGDVILDGGNSYYRDTDRRFARCEEQGICYVGVGVSGGEKGALYGPSMMPGGSLEGYEKTKAILQAVAAKADGVPCCTYISKGGAGHYVKMVHNGIEYAILQLLAETYQYMKQGLHMTAEEMTRCFTEWKTGELESYLIDISVTVLKKMDEDGTPLVEKILDVAGQKGTGKWTLQEGVERGVYIPSIYEAVSARNFSGKKELRKLGKETLHVSAQEASADGAVEMLRDALLAGIILCYSQGLELIVKASEEEGWDIDMAGLVDVWRDGCIIRSRLLGQIKEARVSQEKPLLLSEAFAGLKDLEPALRRLNAQAVTAGIPIPGYAGALHYYDYYRMEQMPVNFIQALRDCFGAHTYQRVDREGSFHTLWEDESGE